MQKFTSIPIQDDSTNFEERADYLSESEINDWSIDSKYAEAILKKLLQIGAKLIAGPRGTGKTHYMRKAYFLAKKNADGPFALYISFNHYLRLESFLHKKSNALNIFHSWVLAKIMVHLLDEHNLELNDEHSSINLSSLQKFVTQVEKQQYNEEFNIILNTLSIELVQQYILKATLKYGRKRAILLFDDAALTLNSDYMIEFFDIFRSLKSSHISPKASVYPGTTQFGPRFHIGQDAERILIWQDVQKNEYLDFMKDFRRKRFPDLIIDENIDSLLIYASFGMPRTYLNLLRSYLTQKESSSNDQSIFNKLLSDQTTYCLEEYRSISKKLIQYNEFIETGENLFNLILNDLKEANHQEWDLSNKEEYSRRVIYAFDDLEPENATNTRILNFLEEAGLLYRLPPVSHGPDRKLQRFVPHYAFILHKKVLTKDRGFDKDWLVQKLSSRPSKKQPIRKRLNTLLLDIGIPSLSLPPCHSCETPRLATTQVYCHQCGSKLVNQSTFEICMKYSLTELPLTNFQKKVLQDSSFQTVEDVIVTTDVGRKLREQPRVGIQRSTHIHKTIETWVNEFLV